MVYLLADRAKARDTVDRLNKMALEVQRSLQRGTPLPEITAKGVEIITRITEPNQQIEALQAMAEDLRKRHLAQLLPLAVDEFNAFCEYVSPDEPPASAWHGWLTNKLQEIEYDPELTRFILNCPPGHAKPLRIDTPVLMSNGVWKRLDEIVVGDEVVTDKGRPRKVTAIHEQGILPLLKITTKKGRVINSAYDHPFRVTSTGSEPTWVNAENLKTGDKLQVVPGYRDPTKFIDQPQRTFAAVGLSAAFTALGSNLKMQDVGYRIWVKPDRLEFMSEVLKRAGIVFTPAWCPSNSRYLLKLGLKSLTPYLPYLYKGEYMSERVVPHWIFRSSDDKVREYLRVFLSIKGKITHTGVTALSAKLANYEHAVGIQRLLHRLSIDSVVSGPSATGAAAIRVEGHDLAALLNMGLKIGNLFPEDVTPLRPKLLPFATDEVVSVEIIEPDECRCLTVAEDHTFLANGVVVHNSTYASRLFVAWRLGRNPNNKIIGGGHSQRFVENEFSAKIRNLVRSMEYQQVFPQIKVSSDTSAKDQWAIAGKSGQYAAKGVGQAVHGFRANFICVDDPYARIEEAESAVYRAKVETWFTGDLGSRMLPGGKMFLIMTRFHEADLTGYLLEQNPRLPVYSRWAHVEAPALCIDPETDIMGRKRGEVLWDYYDMSYFLTKKTEWSFQRFSLVYQQNTSAVSNDKVSGKFEFYHTPPHLTPEAMRKAKEAGHVDKSGRPAPNKREYYRRIVVSVDTAAKVNERADYTVIQTWAEALDRKYYLLRQTRKKVVFNDMIRLIEKQAKRDDADIILVEDKGQGTAYIQARGTTNNQIRQAPCPIVGVDPQGQSKEFRFDEISPMIMEGSVWLPSRADWIDAYLKEFGQFPEGAHDDQVDATTQFLKWAKGTRTRFGSKKFGSAG